MKEIKILIVSLFFVISISAYTQNVVVVLIDGARYTETFGDPDRTYIPYMNELANQGTYIDTFYNDGLTYTSRAVPALWCGAWTDVQDTVFNGSETQYTLKPSLFEYFEKQKQPGQNKNIHTLKHVSSLWLQSFHPEYGQDYWPTTYSQGETDIDVLEKSLQVMDEDHPQLLWVYLAGVDHAGHSGNWNEYTQAIKTADSIVNVLWEKIQSDPFYADSTTLLVTNDHGRHTNDFSGHGCGCEGCRHIMFLALGPNIKKNFVSQEVRNTPDFAVTAASILDVEMEYATGNIMTEIFSNSGVYDIENFQMTANSNFISFFLQKNTFVNIEIIDLKGNIVKNVISENRDAGINRVQIKNNKLRGIYLVRINANSNTTAKKVYFN